MRWFRIRKAQIDPELRIALEQYGVPVMQQILSVGSNFRQAGRAVWIEAVRDSVLLWLTEQYDKAERKETWTLTMEAAVTMLVAAELLFSLVVMFKYEIPEFNLQYGIMQKLNSNAADTVLAMKSLREEQQIALQALKDEQSKTNQTAKDQLNLAKRGQAAVEGEQAKKPKLVLNTASGPRSYGPVVMGRSNDLVVYDPNKILVAVTNEGDATANNGLLLMTFESQFKIVVLNPPSSPGLTSEGGIMKVIQIPFNNLRVGVPLFITLKFEGDYRSRPKPSEGIFLSFEATADKLPPSVPLGGITLKFR